MCNGDEHFRVPGSGGKQLNTSLSRFPPNARQQSGRPNGRSLSAHYWNQPAESLIAELHTTPHGLDAKEAAQRLDEDGPNTLRYRREVTPLQVLLRQFSSPLVLILIGAAFISAFVREWIDATIIFVIVCGSVLISFTQEFTASRTIEKLTQRLTLRATVLRDGETQSIPVQEIVPGDVVLLSAGSLVPADGIVLEAKDFFVNQAALTGETFPVEKMPGVVPVEASLVGQTNSVFMGTSARAGTARVLIVQTGAGTVYGQLAQRLTLRPPETEFERGIRHFGYLLTQLMLALTLIVLTANLLASKPPIDSLLFSLALAVGLTPELLPTIIALNLSRGARYMAKDGVIVRHLNAIENLGSMDVLCTDKTGTLTEGNVSLTGAVDVQGVASTDVLHTAYLNAYFQTGLANALDQAILAQAEQMQVALAGYSKVDEIPYDFVRRRLSVVVHSPQEDDCYLITKGALDNVLEICDRVQKQKEIAPLDVACREQIQQQYQTWSAQGIRVLGIATRQLPCRTSYSRTDETGLIFVGFLLFFDPPKADTPKVIADLSRMGVQVKIITGDNRLVAKHLAEIVGMDTVSVLTGMELNTLRDEALWHLAERTTIFAEIDPNQKERIILALQKRQHVVGYLGDGINDAPALHAADVGISVEHAVDVAKEAAGLVLLQPDLDVLRKGIEEGRKIFANTLKYILTTTSANFGNMFSMAGASIFLPFLPLLAKQILLNNFLSDIPGMTIADDRVDQEWVETPHRWNMHFVRNFMVVFGLVSSVFDYMTFGMLFLVIRLSPEMFRTGWFVESLLTELVIALVVRTRRPFFRSRPGRLLWLSTLLIVILTLAIPYLPFVTALGFVPLPWPIMALLIAITLLYVATTEVVKHYFYRHASDVL
ncbi:MAG: magnesium-translocating P-type ATPase [Caldilineaceae bacterium]|nr:magnesium-translocating P-type ATPase [Caldilineaceae bacterium]